LGEKAGQILEDFLGQKGSKWLFIVA